MATKSRKRNKFSSPIMILISHNALATHLLMAFRKRNVALGCPSTDSSPAKEIAPGTKPSSISSHTVTSTGVPSLDSLLGGHGGLVLGSSLLIEESGTTDFSGALLRYYAAQGICHHHVVHLVGVGDGWVRGLPGVVDEKSHERRDVVASDREKMKIAWRYESSGEAGERGACMSDSLSSECTSIQLFSFV